MDLARLPPPHLWDLLLQKLSTFLENRPNENALLCHILLQLFELPKVPDAPKKSKKFQTEIAQFPHLPLELLQWWLYTTQFEKQIESHLTAEQIEGIEAFRKGMEGLRRKMTGIKGSNMKGKDKDHETPASKEP